MDRLALAIALVVGATATAQPVSVFAQRGDAPRHYANFRVGAASNTARPELCLEVAPLSLVSVEACGTGAGFLYRDPSPEIMHLRSKVKLTSWETPVGHLQPSASLGIAELQVGDDGPGLDFGGTGPTGVETAGPEVGLSLRSLTPVTAGFELVIDLTFSVAVFTHAPQLLRPMSVVQPTFSLTAGFGF